MEQAVKQQATPKQAAQNQKPFFTKTGEPPFFAPFFIQPKLTINQPNDIYEQEADATAERIMRMPSGSHTSHFFKPAKVSSVQRKCDHCEAEEKLQRKESSPETIANESTESYISSLSGGRPLNKNERNFFEPRMGYDFGNVRLHTDSRADQSAKDTNALAYTFGNNIVFRMAQYQSDTDAGKKLMAHELTHVIQQSNHVQPTFIQRLDCSLGHLDTECNNAPATCHRADAYCTNNFADTTAVDNLYNNAVTGARAQASGFPNASVNLLHYLDNTGTLQSMPTPIFETNDATHQALMIHRDRFIAGAVARLNDGRLTPGGTAEMVFTNTANAFSILNRTDLGLAVGGYTLCSKVTVQATSLGGNSYEIRFIQWTVQAFDCYNWDPGKGIGLPGASDNDLCCLENNSRARHFRIETAPWANTHAPAMTNSTVTATVPAAGTSAAPTTTPSTTPGGGSSSGGGFGSWLSSLFRR